MSVTYFSRRINGPEAIIEDAVAHHLPQLLLGRQEFWTAGSLTVGAGKPDLLATTFQPEVTKLTRVTQDPINIMSYLRRINKARLETIAERVLQTSRNVWEQLSNLIELNIVEQSGYTYALAPTWRSILPEIVSVEAKVSDWRKAVAQAHRNKIFAHRSYIAMPTRVAIRIQLEPSIQDLGIGILAVNAAHQVEVIKSARRDNPKVWSYYYRLALILAQNKKE
ncbi:hypothetical protein [Herpetosiphon giganteus]|uniref:hypothetical protein n=1 Tax=Herpetosiphon giganteus TaxID=2029754 RepID=UPI00195D7442|nr:hypothetical protein [Herpetosiphon giganteus]MBM7845372.1 hypothetical protein [Herpetosiphon giganteus]